MDQAFSTDERRPRRSYRRSLGITSLIPHSYERGITGALSTGKKKKSTDGATEFHPSRFPAIVGGFNVSYDQASQLFTLSKLNEGRGESYYFEDLPSKVKAEIRKLRLPPKE